MIDWTAGLHDGGEAEREEVVVVVVVVVTLCPWQCLHTWSAPLHCVLCRWAVTHITHIQTHIVLILSIVKSTNNYIVQLEET